MATILSEEAGVEEAKVSELLTEIKKQIAEQNPVSKEEVEKIVKCNEEVDTEEVIGEKEIIVSDVDKDAGMLYKSDKEKMFGYNTR